jgi:hypothetical protein
MLGSGAGHAEMRRELNRLVNGFFLDIQPPGEVCLPLIPSKSPPIYIPYPPRAARQGYVFVQA